VSEDPVDRPLMLLSGVPILVNLSTLPCRLMHLAAAASVPYLIADSRRHPLLRAVARRVNRISLFGYTIFCDSWS
jgi:hypothetical protein